jgi:long-chain acyl-CoA synthetase
MLSEKNIHSNTEAVLESLCFRNAPLQHLHLPLSYSFGLLGQLFPALQTGCETHLYSEIMELASLFEDSKPVGMLSAVPEQWPLICELSKSNLETSRSVTHVVSAGSRLKLSLRRELQERFPHAVLFNNYGMTECSPRILSLSSRDPAFFTEAIGRPVKGISAEFTDDGVLQIKGPQVMLGYIDGIECTDSLLSGDLGYSENGIVYLNGRRDDLVKVSGERISCQDVATCIAEASNVQEVCVLPFEDSSYGKRLAAFISLKDPGQKQDLLAFLKTQLSGNRRPAKVHFLESFPRNASGKTDRRALVEMIEVGL